MDKATQLTLPGLVPTNPESPDKPKRIGYAVVSYDDSREILTRATGFMEDYDYTLNPYRGCYFGCTYCYAAFFSSTENERDTWGKWIKVKQNAVDLMSRRRQGSLDGKTIYMSSVTDPYQPVERKLQLTRRLLEIMASRHQVKIVVQTRSPDVVRDCDLYRRIEERGGEVRVNMTITTDDEDVRRTFEPVCPSNSARMSAISQMQAEGIDSCITMTPLIWVGRPREFADNLRTTGVRKFIVQPFHFRQGRFVAGTRERALELIQAKLGCSGNNLRSRYVDHYRRAVTTLRATLPFLGDGKEGFKPPF